MSTSTLEITALSELVDLQSICDYIINVRTGEECHVKAEWFVKIKLDCCNTTQLLCNEHKELVVSEWNDELVLTCSRHSITYWITWSDVITEIEKL